MTNIENEIDSLHRVSITFLCTIETLHSSAIKITEELLSGTEDIPAILQNYKISINIDAGTVDQHKQKRNNCVKKRR